jgi:glycogen synthase
LPTTLDEQMAAIFADHGSADLVGSHLAPGALDAQARQPPALSTLARARGAATMKVLMTTDAIGGVFLHSVQLAAALRREGVDVTLASMGKRLSNRQRDEVAAAGAELQESEYRLEWMDDPWPDVERAGEWLLELERELCPDVVHINGYAHASLPWRAPALISAHSCVCSWWRAMRAEPAPERYARYRAEVSRGLAAAACTVAPTAAMLRGLTAEYGTLRRSVVIHDGTATAAGTPVPKQAFVLSVGKVWDRSKNIEALDAAAAELAVPVFVAGSLAGSDASAPATFPHVRLLGALRRPQLAQWMQDAAIYAAPALYEPFGASILEAAAAGCTLVLGNIPSLRELWGGAAVFVDPKDAHALARAIEQLLEDGARCQALGARAAARARTYGAELMALRYVSLYRSLLGEQQRTLELARAESVS